MTATVQAVYTTTQGDGGGDGKSITTGTIVSGDRLLVFVGSSTNADAISAPGVGTWAEVTLPDNVVTTSGGQLRCYQGRSIASTTAYAFTLSGGRRTVVGLLIRGEDDSGASMVDVASSLESAAAATHAPPSVTPTASSELVVDCLFFRQFAPDASTCTPPATGLTWTEHADLKGADGNNNVQVAVNSATAGSSGVAISTAVLNTVNVNEPALVARVVIKSAAGGGTTHDATVAAATTASLTATGVVTAQATSSMATTASLAGTGVVTAQATSGPSATATLAAVGAVTRPATSAMATTAALTATATVTRITTASLATTATLSASASGANDSAAAIAATASLSAPATVTAVGAASLTAAFALTAVATVSGDVVKATSSAAVTADHTSTAAVADRRTSTSAVTARATSSGGVS